MAEPDRRAALLARLDELPNLRPELAGRRILLVGTSGQVGLWVLAYLLRCGAQVVATTHRTPIAFSHPNLRWLTLDARAPNALRQVPGGPPDTVIFTAPMPLLTPLLFDLGQAGVRRIVAFGSTSMHAKGDSTHAGERVLVEDLRTGEAALKAFGETYGAGVTVLRPTLIYGLGLDENVSRVGRVLQKFHLFPTPLPADGLRQPVHVDDLAQAVLAVLDNPATFGRAYDLSGGEVLRYDAMVGRIARHLDVAGGAVPVPGLAVALDVAGKVLGRSARIHGAVARRMRQHLHFDHAEAARDFGYAPRGFLAPWIIDPLPRI